MIALFTSRLGIPSSVSSHVIVGKGKAACIHKQRSRKVSTVIARGLSDPLDE